MSTNTQKKKKKKSTFHMRKGTNPHCDPLISTDQKTEEARVLNIYRDI